jgi:O-antigen ligase
LAEQGLPGMFLVFALVGSVILVAMRVYRRSDEAEVKMLALSLMLALLTYFFHGTMNNFLDTDKASVPVWGFMAAIVALDLYSTRNKQKTS